MGVSVAIGVGLGVAVGVGVGDTSGSHKPMTSTIETTITTSKVIDIMGMSTFLFAIVL